MASGDGQLCEPPVAQALPRAAQSIPELTVEGAKLATAALEIKELSALHEHAAHEGGSNASSRTKLTQSRIN
jgi:hypothetical protein